MNFPLVSKLLSMTMLILGVAFVLCLGASLIWDSEAQSAAALRAFIVSGAAALVLAGAFFLAGRNAAPKFFRKEALAVIGLGWITASLAGAIPYIMLVPSIGYSGALFESASGLTTTGATVLAAPEALPPSLLFWRALSQWIGGIGVIVFFVAVLEFLGAGARMLYANEASGSTADFQESRVRSTALKLSRLYGALSGLCAIAYKIAGMSWFDAICHAFTTVATGGFSTRSESIAAFDSPAIEWIAIGFMIAGGTSFLLIIRYLGSNRPKNFIGNTEWITYMAAGLGAGIVVTIALLKDGVDSSLHEAIRDSFFQVTSMLTTTGYSTEDFARWSTLPQMTLLALMILGGCAGSTSGGLKVVRIVVTFQACLRSVRRSFRPKLVQRIRVNGQALDERTVSDMVTYIALVAIICVTAIILASLFEPDRMLDTNESAVIACLFNIGPGLDEVGPTKNFGFFRAHTKIFLSFLMIMGRLEMYAILALLMPSVWKRFK